MQLLVFTPLAEKNRIIFIEHRHFDTFYCVQPHADYFSVIAQKVTIIKVIG